jgi:sulfate adenylyltransferase
VSLIAPYGGSLVDLFAAPDELADLRARASGLHSLQLSERSTCDLELLAVGGFSPLDRFMGQADHERVVAEMRLANGSLFPMPITLPIEPGTEIHLDEEIALRSPKNDLLAILRVEEIYPWSAAEVSQQVFGTQDLRHPIVNEMQRWGRLNVSGSLRALRLPPRHDFSELRLTPQQTRERLLRYGHHNVVAFQTRNPMHRVHEELTKRAIAATDGVLLLHPSVGLTKPGDVDNYTRVRTYQALADHYYDAERILLALLPLAMRMGGPREALWHMLIRRNYGANHFVVGRDHAGPGKDSHGQPFYGPYDAQELVRQHADELQMTPLAFNELVYLPDEDRYEEADQVPSGTKTLSLSGTQVRDDYLDQGRELPTWFTRPEVARIMSQAYPPLHQRGVCLWFTGLSGSGKSTTSEVVAALLAEHGRQITMLDGDVVRTHLSKGLGFSKEDRDTNVLRIGFVASEIVRHGGLAICAAISPYRASRNEARALVGSDQFVEVFVDTPLEECERRDVKGMYAAARRGEIKGWTGIDDPYEAPDAAEIVVDTVNRTAQENARLILDYLIQQGFVLPARRAATAQPVLSA